MHVCESCKQAIHGNVIKRFVFGVDKFFCSVTCWKRFKATEFHK